MEDLAFRIQKLCQARSRRLVLMIGMFASIALVFHTFMLPSRNASLTPEFPIVKIFSKRSSQSEASSPGTMRVGEFSLLSDTRNSTSVVIKEVLEAEVSDVIGENNLDIKTNNIDGELEDDDNPDDDFELGEDGDPDSEFSFNLGNGFILKKVKDPAGGFVTLEEVREPEKSTILENVGESGSGLALASDDSRLNTSLSSEKTESPNVDSSSPSLAASPPIFYVNGNKHNQGNLDANSSEFFMSATLNFSSLEGQAADKPKKSVTAGPSVSSLTTSNNTSTRPGNPSMRKKKQMMPPTPISEMSRILFRNHASYKSMRPRWSSAHDRLILAAKAQIENAPIVKNDQQLYAPIFRNISKFKRSYELMERTLKVYVYKEGKKPIFHQPILKGIYASEGWFMKLMEGNRHFVVKDPRKAHLFYMPFSSRFLEFALYVPGSHNRTNLRACLQNYVDTIAAKYPFWNRTGGADHFLAACHDWAPYETTHTMDRSIRALCNADLANAFRLGKDVSLPETYVRSARDPQRDLGGKPANGRPILAFYAGNMHGYLRPILLQHWENKHPDMKIFGPMPPGVKSKMTYIQHMKNSKYCICPRGYEVNSPRIVEAIFYECVPVIISDNYVPPFFEVLEWEAFSVFVAEADIPRLKEILVSIPEEKYLSLQMGVRKAQQHFLWHSKPLKYDLFHMTLHSIWFNRVYQIKTRS